MYPNCDSNEDRLAGESFPVRPLVQNCPFRETGCERSVPVSIINNKIKNMLRKIDRELTNEHQNRHYQHHSILNKRGLGHGQFKCGSQARTLNGVLAN
uniref:Uncharacterized protein n=1 Tax=uncultured marine thaumarchaeote KM3_52_B01 TaxID=1456176 RepID=A0A075H651_9ARCH|nr:hypothetical protein [uncultured marine thaumarchaeote KM3_52_B01]